MSMTMRRALPTPRAIQPFSDRLMDYIQEGATTVSDMACRFACTIDDIESTLRPLIATGLVEPCGEVQRQNGVAVLYRMRRTTRSAA